MGYKLRSAKEYKVHFGPHTSFNSTNQEDVMDALWDLIDHREISYTGESFDYAEEFEITRESLIEAIHKIRQSKMPLVSAFDNQFFADELQELVDQSDPDNEFVHFFWY